METNQSNIFVQPLEIPKVVDSVEYVAVQKVYVVNQNLNETKEDFRTTAGLSKFFDVSYIELSPDKKALLIALEQRKVSKESRSEALKKYQNQSGTSQKQQILMMVERYRRINQQNRAKGISVKNRVMKFASEEDNKLKLQKLCRQLDGQPFTIYRLGIDEATDSTILKQYVISNTFYQLCGRNIQEEAIKMTQSKIFSEFHTKFNYKKQLFCVLEWCIKRMEQYGRGEEVEEKHTLIFEIDKELIMPNGMIIKTRMKIYNVNPMLYYVIEKVSDPKPTQSEFIPVDDLKDSTQTKPIEGKSFRTLDKYPLAGYKESVSKGSNVEIISKVHKS